MRKIIVLSNGCRPTEDIYFWKSARPILKRWANYTTTRIDCRKKEPSQAELPKDAKYLIFRSLPPSWLNYFSENQHDNLYFVIDDYVDAAKVSNVMPERYRQKLEEMSEQLPIINKIASKIIVASQGLEESYSQFSPSRLNPSILDLSPRLSNFSQSSWKVAYHGTSVHSQDFDKIAPAIVSILMAYPQTIFESLLGPHTPLSLKELAGCYCVRPMPWSTYIQFRRFTRMHIGLAPLMDTSFNRGKSWNKFLDITTSGGVGVYSKRNPYTEVIEDGVNGLLAEDDPKHWEECIKWLLMHPKEAGKMAKNAQKKALKIGHPKWSYRFWKRLLDV